MKEIEHNTPLKLKDQIEYSAGQVVNRAVAQDKNGQAFLLAVDKDASVKEHKADALAIMHALEGEFILNIEGKEHKMKEGDSIILDPDVRHSLTPITPFKIALVKINR
ncbi:MAG: cupin domain-containing protein [Muribaculaceae bacterium]|nr:cupin domain-containing protein [Muribaculaceae bacterium]